MNLINYDPVRLVLVVVVTAQPKTDADNEALLAALDKIDREGASQRKPIAVAICVDIAAPAPSAPWRKRFAEHRKAMKSPRVFFSIVAPTAVSRGALTAINWISPPPDHVRVVCHATVTEAANWIELTHGTPAGALQRMHDEAIARAPKAARAG